MKIPEGSSFLDLHVHGRYSGGTSHTTTLHDLIQSAKLKGLTVIGTGDCLHSQWLTEIKATADYNENTQLLESPEGVYLMLTTEIECRFMQDKTQKRIHNVVCLPSLADVQLLRSMLRHYGSLDADGRPVINLSCEQFVNYIKDSLPDAVVFPAHIWTPHTSLLGALHGFTGIRECYQSATKHIRYLETGLSSDIVMNSLFKETQTYTLISNSDAHSSALTRLGREATIISIKDITYKNIHRALATDQITKRPSSNFIGTIEVPPEYGKYHLSGHRFCNISADPETYSRLNGTCPVCGKKLTIGVLQRIASLSNGFTGQVKQQSITLLPLSILLSFFYSPSTVEQHTTKLLSEFGNEFNVLLNVSSEDITKATNQKVAELIIANRENKLKLKAGYDGVYGEPESKSKTFELKGLTEIFGS
jgi:uncharacterized protein (TIGR00375 family)